jgi:CRISPR-associated protein Csb1
MEKRRIGGEDVSTVLLDSVASQANRMEEALLEAFRRGELNLPVVEVDFTSSPAVADLDRITSLNAPHRIADALLRDSIDAQGRPFRQTPIGMACTDARPNHATGMYVYCPTALVFGVWDSTGPKGGLGAKFTRCISSEIVGVNVQTGVKVGSRIDPAGIQRNAGPIFEAKDNPAEWTTLDSEAALEKGKPKLFGRKSSDAKEKGTPAGINHGNIPPAIDAESGGVTMDYAEQTWVLSLAGLRRLRFQTRADGSRIEAAGRQSAEDAARTALAALALAALVMLRESDFDLRSRTVLVAEGPLVLELIHRNGEEPTRFTLSRAEAAGLVAAAQAEAARFGMSWAAGAHTFAPAPKLTKLIEKSRELAAAGQTDEAGGA